MTTAEKQFLLELADKSTAADDVIVLKLRDPTGAPLPAWKPGAHIDIILPSGLVRQYSLCGDPRDRSVWRVAVLRNPRGRGGSLYVHEMLTVGDHLTVRGPRNNFLLAEASEYLFIAGGIGITPILPMIAHAHEMGASWQLVYGGRSKESMAFIDEVSGYGDRVQLWPQDEKGMLNLPALLDVPRADTLVYSCGPAPLLDAVTDHCRSWPAGAVRLERFSAKDLDTPLPSTSFDVELALSGMTVEVKPDQSILQAVREAGVKVNSSCEEGTCGTCETPVIAGTVDHRDSLLSSEEKTANCTIMICVSRSTCSRLTLEL